MFRLLTIAAAIAIITLLVHATAVLAFQATYRLPCMISYDGRMPITTTCLVNIGVTGDRWLETVKTENGRAFVIEKTNTTQWYLDHERAVKVSDEPNTCYQSLQVRVCL